MFKSISLRQLKIGIRIRIGIWIEIRDDYKIFQNLAQDGFNRITLKQTFLGGGRR